MALSEADFVARAKEAGLTFSILEHILYDYPAGHPWPGHSITVLPSLPKGDKMATADRSHAPLPPPRDGFTRFSGTAVDVKWAECPVGTELFGRWLGWRPSSDPSWNPLGAMEIDGATKVFPLVTALRVLMRVPPGTQLAVIYLGRKVGKRGGQPFHNFALDYPDGTVLLPDPESAEPDENRFSPRETTGR